MLELLFVIRRRISAISQAPAMLITRRTIRAMTDCQLFELAGDLFWEWRFSEGDETVAAVRFGLVAAEMDRRRRRRIVRGGCTCSVCMRALEPYE